MTEKIETDQELKKSSKTKKVISKKPGNRLTKGSISVAVVLAMSGLLFTVNARLAADPANRQPRDLPELIASEESRLEERSQQIQKLDDEIASLSSDVGGEAEQLPGSSANTIFAAGGVAVKGPGVKVQLWDAQGSFSNQPGLHPDDFVVHQQDVQAVIDALWSGGAEAMTIQGQRVISTTAVRCVGNTLLVHGRTYSPPYVIEAIGDSKKLRRTVNGSPPVKAYLEYVDRLGLGWSMDSEAEIKMPAHEGIWEMKYAHVPTDAATRGS